MMMNDDDDDDDDVDDDVDDDDVCLANSCCTMWWSLRSRTPWRDGARQRMVESKVTQPSNIFRIEGVLNNRLGVHTA